MKIDKCPHCGNDEEFYTKDYAFGSVRSLSRFDGRDADNSEMGEGIRYKMGKFTYCGECHKKIAKVEDMEG